MFTPPGKFENTANELDTSTSEELVAGLLAELPKLVIIGLVLVEETAVDTVEEAAVEVLSSDGFMVNDEDIEELITELLVSVEK